MSRFSGSVSNEKYDQKSLCVNDQEYIFKVLINKLYLNKKEIEEVIYFFVQNSMNYHVFNLDEEVIFVLKKSESSSLSLSIGYPFPLHTIRKVGPIDNVIIDFYIRGKIVRNSQRSQLLKELDKKYEVQCINLGNKTHFKETFRNKAKKYKNKNLAYYDMYRFIGDSIINTWMVDEFVEYFSPKDLVLFSRNYSHLSRFYKTNKLNNYEQLINYDVVVIADLIDISNGETQNIICNMQGNGLYIILSRNIFIEKKDNKMFVYYFESDYTLFNTQNIYPYMKCVVNDFIDSKKGYRLANFVKRQPILKTIFFNPYASLIQKSLTYEESVSIIERLNKNGYDVLIPFGHTSETIKKSHMISQKSRCKTIDTKNISELADFFLDKNIIVITVDSAISHLAAKCNNYCITLFRNGFWDKYSLQSLCNESPIGFSSYSYNQLPLIMKNMEMDIDQLEIILRVIYTKTLEPIKSNILRDIADKSLYQKLYEKGIEIEKLELDYKLRKITGEKDVL